MSGKQIEELSLLIDRNVAKVDDQAAAYIETHLPELIAELRLNGKATIETKSGPLVLDLADLNLTFA